MYVLHLTEVLLINNTKMKLCVCVCARVFERKAVIATEYKTARFLQRKKNVFFFFMFLFLSPFSNTIEPKGHFIDHSEVMSPVVCLLSLT